MSIKFEEKNCNRKSLEGKLQKKIQTAKAEPNIPQPPKVEN